MENNSMAEKKPFCITGLKNKFCMTKIYFFFIQFDFEWKISKIFKQGILPQVTIFDDFFFVM
jgi:hypothetical protein